jgi:hypothetical protein
MKRFFKWTGALMTVLALAAGGTLLWARWALTAQQACDLPCRDLGREPAIGPDGKPVDGVYRPGCPFVTLKLELARPVARRNTPYALWHRVTLRNNSCFELGSTWAHDFLLNMDEWEYTRQVGLPMQTLGFRVWGPDGREVPRLLSQADDADRIRRGWDEKSPPPRVPAPKRTMFLYDIDPDYKRWFKDTGIDGDWFLGDLLPGKAIYTVPSVLHPKSRTGWLTMREPAPPGAETPPPGFKILDWFIFTQPGTYRIQAVFEKSDLGVSTIRPHRSKVPLWLYHVMAALDEMTGWGVNPLVEGSFWHGGTYHVRVESNTLEFTVEP